MLTERLNLIWIDEGDSTHAVTCIKGRLIFHSKSTDDISATSSAYIVYLTSWHENLNADFLNYKLLKEILNKNKLIEYRKSDWIVIIKLIIIFDIYRRWGHSRHDQQPGHHRQVRDQSLHGESLCRSWHLHDWSVRSWLIKLVLIATVSFRFME